jgi:hypothetical protein
MTWFLYTRVFYFKNMLFESEWHCYQKLCSFALLMHLSWVTLKLTKLMPIYCMVYKLSILCIAVKWYLKRDPKCCDFSIAQNKVNILYTYLNILISYEIFGYQKNFVKSISEIVIWNIALKNSNLTLILLWNIV